MKQLNKDFSMYWPLLLACLVMVGCSQQKPRCEISNSKNNVIEIRGRKILEDNSGSLIISEIPNQQLDQDEAGYIEIYIGNLSKNSSQKTENQNFKIASSDYVEIKQNGEVVLCVTTQVVYKKNDNYWAVYRDNRLSEQIDSWIFRKKIKSSLSKLPPPVD